MCLTTSDSIWHPWRDTRGEVAACPGKGTKEGSRGALALFVLHCLREVAVFPVHARTRLYSAHASSALAQLDGQLPVRTLGYTFTCTAVICPMYVYRYDAPQANIVARRSRKILLGSRQYGDGGGCSAALPKRLRRRRGRTLPCRFGAPKLPKSPRDPARYPVGIHYSNTMYVESYGHICAVFQSSSVMPTSCPAPVSKSAVNTKRRLLAPLSR